MGSVKEPQNMRISRSGNRCGVYVVKAVERRYLNLSLTARLATFTGQRISYHIELDSGSASAEIGVCYLQLRPTSSLLYLPEDEIQVDFVE